MSIWDTTATDIEQLAAKAVSELLKHSNDRIPAIYGIPRGGVAVAYLIADHIARRRPEWPRAVVLAARDGVRISPDSLIVDDIVDSGDTMRPCVGRARTLALVVHDPDKLDFELTAYGAVYEDWVRFPWDERSGKPEDAVVRLLEYLGLDPKSESVRETPRRVLGWLDEFRPAERPEPTLFSGVVYDEMVVVKDIQFVSLCEHHLLPFTGAAAVGYIPAGVDTPPSTEETRDEHLRASDAPSSGSATTGVIGLSKIARLVQFCARRPTMQERLATEIKDEIMRATGSPSVAVVLEAEHLCMSLRGPKVPGAKTVTSALSGCFMTDSSTRQEFMSLVR